MTDTPQKTALDAASRVGVGVGTYAGLGGAGIQFVSAVTLAADDPSTTSAVLALGAFVTLAITVGGRMAQAATKLRAAASWLKPYVDSLAEQQAAHTDAVAVSASLSAATSGRVAVVPAPQPGERLAAYLGEQHEKLSAAPEPVPSPPVPDESDQIDLEPSDGAADPTPESDVDLRGV